MAMTLLCRLVLSIGLVFVVSAPARAETIQVIIDRLEFSPAVITARVGDTIEWVNRDVMAHTATVKGGREIMLPPKKTETQRLDTAQAVDFYCRFHPNMKGSLTVDAR